MQNKVLYIVLAVLVIALLGLYIYGKSKTETPTVQTNTQNSDAASALDDQAGSDMQTNSSPDANANANANANSAVPAANTQGQFSGEEDIQSGDTAVHEITYDGSKFSPASLTVKKGDIVVFKNAGTKGFWPASGPHPQHTNYPEFDAKASVAPGQSFQFKFVKPGNWPFHDHLNSSAFGTIKVNE